MTIVKGSYAELLAPGLLQDFMGAFDEDSSSIHLVDIDGEFLVPVEMFHGLDDELSWSSGFMFTKEMIEDDWYATGVDALNEWKAKLGPKLWVSQYIVHPNDYLIIVSPHDHKLIHEPKYGNL